MMTVESLVAATICLRSSMPLMPGSWLSRRMQAGSLRGFNVRYSSAEPKDLDSIWAVDRSRVSASRTFASSSTMCTQRSCSIVFASICRQLDYKSRTPCRDRFPPEAARVPLNDPPAQVQAKAHPSRLGGLIGVKNVVREVRRHSPAIVLDPEHDSIAFCGDLHGHAPA